MAGEGPELYGELDWDVEESGEQGNDEPVVVPPVRLAPRAELAREAAESPLFSATLRLARWAGAGRPVDEFGELTEEQEAAAERELGSGDGSGDGGGGEGLLWRAWPLAVDLELVAMEKSDGDSGGEVARPGAALKVLDESDPESVLALWELAASVVLETAVEAEPDVDALFGAAGGSGDAAEEPSQSELEAAAEAEYARIEEATEGAQELLDEALLALYTATALASEDAEPMPLGVLAALLVVPEGEEPDQEMLGEITSVMVELDPMLQDLAEIGVLDFRPIDPELFDEGQSDEEQSDEAGAGEDRGGEQKAEQPEQVEVTEAEAARFGQVRLTPLGAHAVRGWLLAEGYDAPLIGEHAGGTAKELLSGITEAVNVLPEEEIREWAAGREPVPAAGELLEAARGTDPLSPVRRMFCQVALSELGAGAEPAVRAVLDDPQLGGFGRAWLVDQGAADVPEPERTLLLWTTVDTLAAQILDDAVELELVQELIEQLPVRQDPAAFFEEFWRIDHPYTAEVLDAIGELHPDRTVAKEARRAAHKARSA
jgi:hypothetical protein